MQTDIVSAADTETQLTDRQFQQIASIIKCVAGINLSDEKRLLVRSRLARRLRALRLDSYDQYIAYLDGGRMTDEVPHLVTALTTNVTSFFRELHHFEYLAGTVVQQLSEKISRGETIKVWSAGCSTGAEVYSIAACLMHHLPAGASRSIKMLATDIDEQILNVARTAEYPAQEIEGKIPSAYKSYFRRCGGDTVQPIDDIRNLVSVRHLNLIEDWPVKGPFDVIFCRNVVIYFEPSLTQSIWEKFHNVLAPGGHFFIGHSERLSGAAADQFRAVGVTTYQKTV